MQSRDEGHQGNVLRPGITAIGISVKQDGEEILTMSLRPGAALYDDRN